MAAKNWRENSEASAPQDPKKTRPATSAVGTMRLGPIVRAISLVLIGIALVFLAIKVWDEITPDKKTAIYCLNSSEAGFKAAPFSPSLYLDESIGQFPLAGANLKRIDRLGDSTSALGPQKNTALFYLYGDLSTDENGQLLISKNRLNGNRFDDVWQSVRDQLVRICEEPLAAGKQGINRVVFLDVGQVDAPLLAAAQPLSEQIEKILFSMKSEVKNSEKLWVVISADGKQTSWYAPEMGSSLFSFFVANGLAGWAGDERPEISLAQLFDYVEKSVAHWARDFRDSTQTPKLISLNDTTQANQVSVIYSNPNRASPSVQKSDYQKTKPDALWKKLTQVRRLNTIAPHQLAMIESRLIRLEEARFSYSENSRSQRVFEKLELEISDLIDSLPRPAQVGDQVISLEQLPNASSIDLSGQKAIRAFLFPPPGESVSGGAPVTDNSEQPESDGATPATSGARPQPQIPPTLKKLDKNDRLKLVWQYFCSDQALEDPLSSAHFKKSLNYIQEGRGDSGPTLDGKNIPLVELQYLQILDRNFSTSKQGEDLTKQKNAFLMAIQCRQMSESIIQGSVLGSEFHANQHKRAWSRVRAEYKRLEDKRRRAEDALWANEMNVAVVDLAELRKEYKNLASDLKILVQLRSVALEAIGIVPYLRTFLTREATIRETSPAIETEMVRVNDVERLALSTLDGIQAGSLSAADRSGNLRRLREELQRLERYFRVTYQSRLLAAQSASEPVFHGLNFLATPIPEWLAKDQTSQRSVIRRNVDDWIKKQRTKFHSEWLEDSRQKNSKEGELPSDRLTLAANDFDRLVIKSPKYAFSNLAQFEPTGFLSVGQYLNQLKPGAQRFKDSFDYKNRAIANRQSLTELQREFAKLDLEINIQNQVLSNAESSLDLGPQLSVIDDLLTTNDKLERSLLDCWGNGDVEDLVNQAALPPFVNYATLYRGELKTGLEALANFKSRSDTEQPEYQVAPLRQSFDREIADANRIWKQLRSTTLSWPNQPPTFLRGETVELKTDLTSELLPDEITDRKTLTMGSKWRVNGKQIAPVNPFIFESPRSPVSIVRVPSTKLLSNNRLESIVSLRGHQFVQPFSIREGKPPVVTTVLYRTIHRKPVPGPSLVQVINGEEYRADIVFILDCSKSMEKKARDKLGREIKTNATRFVFAKEALKTAIVELMRENRFRFGLYAFGHRVGFKINDNDRLVINAVTGRAEVTSNKYHPFDDSEALYRLGNNRDVDVATLPDIQAIIGKIDQLEPKGITPLYYTIREVAINEFFESESARRRYIIVLTDGKNLQFGSSKKPLATLPPSKTILDATSKEQVRDIITERKIDLFVARTSETGAIDDRESRELVAAGAQVLSVLESDSVKISEAILNAIGRNEYSLTPKGESAGKKNKISPQETASTRQTGDFVVETFGVDKPSRFEISLEGDETVFLENTSEGLKLRNPKPRFLSDGSGTNEKVNTGFGNGDYDIGRMKSRSETELAFGFHKTNNANDASRNFSFRPQRVWAQIKDRESGMTTSLFLPVYDPGSFPVARFELPQELLDHSDTIDIVLWVTPNERDGWPAIDDSRNEMRILPGENELSELECERHEDEDLGSQTIKITSGNDPRGYFVDCPAFDSFTIETTYKDEIRTQDIYEFLVPRREANFWLRVLPREEFQAIMHRVDTSTKRVDTEKDPIFGDNAVWIKFQNVKIK